MSFACVVRSSLPDQLSRTGTVVLPSCVWRNRLWPGAVVAGATVSTVNGRDTTALSFPAASIALTKKVWVPSGERRGPGERRGARREKAWASKWHWKVEPASFEVNEKVGVASLVSRPGPGPR